MSLQCPRCYVALKKDTEEGTEIDACPKCGGLWFDPEELGKLAKGRPGGLAGLEHRNDPLPELDQSSAPSPLCPACREHLQEFEYPWAPGVRLDGCVKCKGIWVDDGELSRIEAHVARWRREAVQAAHAGSRAGTVREFLGHGAD